MSQQSIMFVSEPGRLQRSRWKILVPAFVFPQIRQPKRVQGKREFTSLFLEGELKNLNHIH